MNGGALYQAWEGSPPEAAKVRINSFHSPVPLLAHILSPYSAVQQKGRGNVLAANQGSRPVAVLSAWKFRALELCPREAEHGERLVAYCTSR